MTFKKNLAIILAGCVPLMVGSSCVNAFSQKRIERPLCPLGTRLVVTKEYNPLSKTASSPQRSRIGVNEAWNNCYRDKNCKNKHSGFYEFQRKFEMANKFQDYQFERGMDYYCTPNK